MTCLININLGSHFIYVQVVPLSVKGIFTKERFLLDSPSFHTLKTNLPAL